MCKTGFQLTKTGWAPWSTVRTQPSGSSNPVPNLGKLTTVKKLPYPDQFPSQGCQGTLKDGKRSSLISWPSGDLMQFCPMCWLWLNALKYHTTIELIVWKLWKHHCKTFWDTAIACYSNCLKIDKMSKHGSTWTLSAAIFTGCVSSTKKLLVTFCWSRLSWVFQILIRGTVIWYTSTSQHKNSIYTCLYMRFFQCHVYLESHSATTRSQDHPSSPPHPSRPKWRFRGSLGC